MSNQDPVPKLEGFGRQDAEAAECKNENTDCPFSTH